MSKGRTHISLEEYLRAARPQAATYWRSNDPRRYEGLEQCFKNVIKCGCYKKLKYCIKK